MNRRKALSIIVTGPLCFAGCLDQADGESPSTTSSDHSTQNKSFQIYPYDEFQKDTREPPSVRLDRDQNQVNIRGQLFVGSEKCHEAKLEKVTYNESEDHLSVVVTRGKSDNHPDNNFLGLGSCNDEMTPDGYEVLVTFKETLPLQVTAIERDADDETKTTNITTDTI